MSPDYTFNIRSSLYVHRVQKHISVEGERVAGVC